MSLDSVPAGWIGALVAVGPKPNSLTEKATYQLAAFVLRTEQATTYGRATPPHA